MLTKQRALFHGRLSVLLIGSLSAAIVTNGLAAELAGRVLVVRGEAAALDHSGSQRALARRDRVFVGDTLQTGADSTLQLRFTDSALLTLQPDSRFTIHTYAPGDAERGGAALMELVSGGFRTLTGHIGKGERDAYEVRTNATSIGIRGTDFAAQALPDERVIVAVWNGSIQLDNPAGSLLLGAEGEYRFAEIRPQVAPKGLLDAPAEFQSTAEPAATAPSAKQTADTGPKSVKPDSSRSTQSTTNSPSLASTLTDPTSTAAAETAQDITATNPDLTQTLIETVDPTAPAAADPRLSNREYLQLTQDYRVGAAVVAGTGEVILATLIADDPSALIDFSSAGAVSFEVQYSVGLTTPVNVTVTLASNITSLSDLVADISDDLAAAVAPVGVRESTQFPDRLEFFTNTGDVQLGFGLVNFDTSGSTITVTDLTAVLGGLNENLFSDGFVNSQQSGLVRLVGDSPQTLTIVRPIDAGDATSTAADAGLLTPGAPDKYAVARRDAAALQGYDSAVGGRSNVQWGYWNATAATSALSYPELDQPALTETITERVFWMETELAAASTLTGIATFSASGEFIGAASDGAIQSVSGQFVVDFDNGAINSGNLAVTTDTLAWNTPLSGSYQDSQAIMDAFGGDISGAVNCTGCVGGSVQGIFVAPGDAFAGSFDLEDQNDPSHHTEGLMLFER